MNYTALQNLKVEYNAKDEDNYCMNKLENIRRDLRFDPGAAYSLGKRNRIPGRNLAI